MAKFKKKDTKEKISLQGKQKRGCSCEQYPAFSFRYLTKNNRYNFLYFNTEVERKNARNALLERIEEITKYPYTYWLGQGKTYGCELLEFWKCKFNPDGLNMTNDDKVFVFRFSNQDYRMIGIKLDACPTLYIIGLDFDYSAYNHGT